MSAKSCTAKSPHAFRHLGVVHLASHSILGQVRRSHAPVTMLMYCGFRDEYGKAELFECRPPEGDETITCMGCIAVLMEVIDLC